MAVAEFEVSRLNGCCAECCRGRAADSLQAQRWHVTADVVTGAALWIFDSWISWQGQRLSDRGRLCFRVSRGSVLDT